MKQVEFRGYKYSNHLGEISTDVMVWIDDEELSEKIVDSGDFSIDEFQIKLLDDQIVYDYLKENFLLVQGKNKRLYGSEIQGIMDYMGLVSNDDFARLIGHDKSTISRVKKQSGEEKLSVQASIAILMFLWEEYRASGFCKRLLGLEQPQRREDFDLPWYKADLVANEAKCY